MPVLLNSRYMGQPVVSVPTDDLGGTASAVFGPPLPAITNFSYYVVQQGDRFDSISNTVYGLPDYWWQIAYANPEVFYPDSLTIGSIIRIPIT
jgi:hypothetical protein